MSRSRNRLFFLVAFGMTVLAGRWGMGLFTTSEYVHFSVNFPTVGPPSDSALEPPQQSGRSQPSPARLGVPFPQLTRSALGGPWARLPEGAWSGYPAGGILVWGREGRVEVDLGQRSFLKAWLQPNTLLLSTHWLRNVGTVPRRIRLSLDLCDLSARWLTFERNWDAKALSFTRSIPPGATANMDWPVRIPRAALARPVVCAGSLRVWDADENTLLTELPVLIRNRRSQAGALENRGRS